MKRWRNRAFHKADPEKPTDETILRRLLPSFAGIFACMVCLAGCTWAWFTATLQTGTQQIAAAEFSVFAAVDGAPVSSPVRLYAGQTYTVTLTADRFGGCCLIRGGETDLCTKRLMPGESYTFSFTPDTTADYTFCGVWGDPPTGAVQIDAQPADTAESANQAEPAEAAAYTVQPGDTLWDLAQSYGISAEALAAYNGLDDPGSLQIGQVLQIPEPTDAAADTVSHAATDNASHAAA